MAPPNAHEDAAADQPPEGRSEPTQKGEAREHRGAKEEDPAPAEDVGQPPPGDDQDAEDQRVAVDHPLDVGDVGPEVPLDLG
jgi:hypothetical protein